MSETYVALDVVMSLVGAAPLAFAGLAKLFDPGQFRAALQGYPVLPAAVRRPVEYGLPAVELITAAAIILLPSAASALVASALYTAFAILLFTSWRRGARGECGCFGPASSPIGPAAILRSGALGFLCLVLALTRLSAPTHLSAPDLARAFLALTLALACASVIATLRMLRA